MERNTHRRSGTSFSHDLKAGAKIFLGTIVALQAGYAMAGHAANDLTVVGVAKETVDNTEGGDGDVAVTAETGTFSFANGADADAITRQDIGKECYVLNAITVAKTDGGGTRSKCGVIRAVEGAIVWVTI